MKKRKGFMMIDVLFGIVMLILTFYVILSFMPIVFNYIKLETFSGELTRYVEVKGRTDLSSLERDLAKQQGITPVVKYKTTYYKDKKVQLDTKIDVISTFTVKVKIFGLEADIPLTIKKTGVSEVYWK